MKRRKRGSRSTFRAELIVQQPRDKESGLFVSDRFFLPDHAPRAHHILWTLTNTVLLACLMAGMLRLLLTGFSIPADPWLYPAVLGLCLVCAAAFQSEWIEKHGLLIVLPSVLVYLVLLFLFQDVFLLGLRQLANRAVEQLNAAYSGSITLPFPVSGTQQIGSALFFLAAPAVLWLSWALLHSGIALMMELLVFPVLLALLLFGAANDLPGLFLVLTGIVMAMAFVRAKRQRRMWGGSNTALTHANRVRYQHIQKQSALVTLVLCVLLAVPGFLLVRPLLDISLGPARTYSTQVRTEALNRVLKSLPGLTAGQWQLNVEAVSGGVQDGSLGGDSGYLLEGVEDLRLTVTRKPVESLFLKGFVGAFYENGSWEPPHAYAFDGAAINWKTEGAPRLYIQNLPFLRTAFALAQGEEGGDTPAATLMKGFTFISPAQLYVERLNANPGYTYVPYGAYLNDYYQTAGGDGAIVGQSDQQDRYFFFQRDEMEAVLNAWNGLDETANVLDRVEESYRAFCNTTCLAVPAGMEILAAEVAQVQKAERWMPARDLESITLWIRRYLAENYSYELTPEAPPEGEDVLSWFLFTSHRGNSVHFASAAVVLYRLFGVPARYVVGYEVPPALFTAQSGGIYSAVVQGDQSQAWAEVYEYGLGWSPRDMTPGVIGTLEEVGPGGIRVVTSEEQSEESEEEDSDPDIVTGGDTIVVPDDDERPAGELSWLSNLSLEQIIIWVAAVAGGLLGLVCMFLLGRSLCRALGLSLPGRRKPLVLMVGVFQAVYKRAVRLHLPAGTDSQSAGFRDFLVRELTDRSVASAAEVVEALDVLYCGLYGRGSVELSDVRRMRRILLGLYHRRGARKVNPG